MRGFAFCLLLLTPCVLFAQEPATVRTGELALSNDTLWLRYIGDGNALNMSQAQIAADLLTTEDRDLVFSGALLFPANLDLGRLSFRFGPRAYAALLEEENNDVLSISVGVTARFDIDTRRRFAVTGEAFYAPDILTFGTADNLTDFSARAEIGLGERLTGFGGMRWFEFDLTEGQGKRTLQEEAFFGVGYRF